MAPKLGSFSLLVKSCQEFHFDTAGGCLLLCVLRLTRYRGPLPYGHGYSASVEKIADNDCRRLVRYWLYRREPSSSFMSTLVGFSREAWLESFDWDITLSDGVEVELFVGGRNRSLKRSPITAKMMIAKNVAPSMLSASFPIVNSSWTLFFSRSHLEKPRL